jgi:phosphopantothenoylcysteine synthetase/decarboxylase
MSDFRTVATGEGVGSPRYILNNPLKTAQPGVITENVRQTWSVANLAIAKKIFLESLPANVKTNVLRDSDGDLTLKVVLTKKALAELVRKCSAGGFKLLSPSQPQPEQNVFAGDSGAKVHYSAILVQD